MTALEVGQEARNGEGDQREVSICNWWKARVREKPLRAGPPPWKALTRTRTQTARDPGTGLTEGLGKPCLRVSSAPLHILISPGWEVQVLLSLLLAAREPGQTGLKDSKQTRSQERENIHFHSPPGTAIIPLERAENLDLSTEQFSL